MDPHLDRLRHEISSAIAKLSPERLIAHPPGKWCTAEILEHLYLTFTGTTKGFQRVVESGQPKVTSPTWKQRGRALVVLGFGHLPAGREAPVFLRPRGLSPEIVQKDIVVKLSEMDAMLAVCETKFGERARVLDHAILGPLTVSQWRKFHLVHGRHHLKQIRQLQNQKSR